jgi:hypothetical protein
VALEYKDIVEILAIRPGCKYEMYTDEPEDGTWWAVMATPVCFPGDHHAITPDGAPVECAAIIACERRKDNGLWVWCHLSQAAKRLFCDIIFDNQLQIGKWYYCKETSI